ncbi:endolytic transglycosylase MltG [Soehngenia saccharolytica]|nr:endolytic transglycosylase MltG [Soehngenia saccharolytica]
MRKKIIALIIVAIIILIGLVVLPRYLSHTINKEEVVIEVEQGDNLKDIANKLYEVGAIRSKTYFYYKGKSIGTNIKTGEYKITQNMEFEDIYKVLTVGNGSNTIKVTFPEGFTLYQFATKLEDNGLVDKDEFITATENYFDENISKEVDNKDMYFSLEGYLFPDTYFFSKNQNAKDIVALLVGTLNDKWTQEMEDQRIKIDKTKHEILTIASLIEREAYNDEERAKISGVIYNRIKIGMPLQIDASVIYGKGKGKEHTSVLTKNDLLEPNPYNTYLNKGLPPGPIASPGLKSIKAALYPEEHEYYYYVMGENGHVFAKTYEEHMKNVEKYRNMK